MLQIGRNNGNRKEIVAENIANAIIELIHYSGEPIKINLSDFLREKLKYEYARLAKIFSEVKGTSIEKFFIAHKIEHVKDLLINDELNLTEISILTNYSSVAHLSNQFKRKTGLSAIQYKQLHSKTLSRSIADDHKINYHHFAKQLS